MIVRALFTRPARRRPGRFFATCLGVAVGVCSVVSTFAASRAALAALRDGVRGLAGGAAFALVRDDPLTNEDLSRLQGAADLGTAAPILEHFVLAPELGDSVRLLGIDPLAQRLTRDLGEVGRDVAAFEGLLAGRGAWISSDLAADLAVTRTLGSLLPPRSHTPAAKDTAQPSTISGSTVGGTTLELDLRSRRIAVPVLAVFPQPQGTRGLERTVVIDVALFQELSGRWNEIDRIDVTPRAGVEVAELRARLQGLVRPGTRLVTPEERAADTWQLVRALDFNLTALSMISLVVGLVLVATTLATSVVRRAPTIAILRSLGASQWQIARAVLAEALAIGTLGGLLGVGLAAISARFMVPGLRSTYASVVAAPPPAEVEISLGLAGAGLLLGIAVALVASILPLRESARTPPVQALKAPAPSVLSATARRVSIGAALAFTLAAIELSRQEAWYELPIAGVLAAFAVLGALFCAYGPIVDACGRWAARARRTAIVVRLAGSALASNRQRAVWAAAAVGTAVALSVSIAALVGSFRDGVASWTNDSLRAPLSIRPSVTASGTEIGALDPGVVAVATAVIGQGFVDAYYREGARVDDRPVTLSASDFTTRAQHGGFVFLDGRPAREVFALTDQRHGVLVNEAFQRRFRRNIGDRVRIDVAGHVVEREITGVLRDYSESQGTLTIDQADFLAILPHSAPRAVSVFLPADANREAERRRLALALIAHPAAAVLLSSELRDRVLSIFDATFAVTYGLQVVAAIVAVLAVLSVLFALVSERSADLALMRALGASRGQMLSTVAFQATLLGLVGAVTGSIVGLVVGVILVDVVFVQSFGWSMPFLQPWSEIATTIVLVVGACLVCGFVPAWRALRPGNVLAVRDE